MSNICPNCQEEQYSPVDKKYVELFGHCWTEDKETWQKGELSLLEFENREKEALENEPY